MKTFLKAMVPALLIATTSYADKLVVMESPIESLETRVELLMHAQKTIDVQYFTVEHDYVSIAGLALLRDAANRGVKVRVIVDSMHNLMTRETMSALMDNLNPDSKKNIEIREYNNFNLFRPFCYTRRMHDKSLIIDDQYLIVGDRNVASGYYNIPETHKGESLPLFEGVDALLAGSKSIGEAKAYFEQRWNSKDVKPVQLYNFSETELDYSFCRYTNLENYDQCERRRQEDVRTIQQEMKNLEDAFQNVVKKNIKLITERPALKALAAAYETEDVRFIHDDASRRVCKGKNPELNIGKSLYETIAANTEKDLIIVTPYLDVTPEMEALIKKLVLEKGVLVRFLTNSRESNDVPSATAGYLATRHRLMDIDKAVKSGRAGVKIYEFHNISNAVLKDDAGNIVRQGKAIDTVHAKMVLMDHKKAFIGSYNWDYRSQNLNSEVGIIVGLEGSNTSNPTKEIRGRIAGLLTSGKLVNTETGKTNNEDKIRVELSADEQTQMNEIIEGREDGIKLWGTLLRLPIIGELLLNQL